MIFCEKIVLDDVIRVLDTKEPVAVDSEWMRKVQDCYDFLKNFSSNKVIYGINTGFGPMAQWRVDDQYLTDLQYNIIRSHACGAGKPLEDKYVKAAMIARLGTVLQCRSGVHPEVVELLLAFINHDIIPFIPEHGNPS